MVKVIMHGCNGKMGQVISGLIAADPDMELVAGIDARDDGHNPYPVFTDIAKCDVAADCIIDFSAAVAVDKLLNYCVEKKIPCVLCTTGLSEELQLKVVQLSRTVAVFKSANMSMGINVLSELCKRASAILGVDYDVEKLLRSAIANWEAKNDRKAENGELFITKVFVDEGVTMKRMRPAPQGRGYRIRKRSNHVTLFVDSKTNDEK